MPTSASPYWWEQAPRLHLEAPTLAQSVDVAVIGAGYSGLCAALVLARAGVTVAVFEAGALGCGASTLNGGMVGPSFHKLGVAGMKKKFGAERSNAILKESINFVDFIEEFLRVEKIDAEFSRVGRFRGALKLQHFDAMARELEILQRAIGVQGEMIAKAEQTRETGSSLFHGGVVYQQDGGLHPAKYHDGLVLRAREAGVSIFPDTAVVSLEKKGSDYKLHTARGDIVASQIAVCTNGYTGKITPRLRRRVLPIRSAMIATQPLAPELIKHLMPQGRLYGDSRRLVAYYRPSPDGTRILFGGRAANLKDNPEANTRELRASMVQVYPELAQVSISHVWSGLVAYTFDHVPHLGQLTGGSMDGIFYAMGYCGSGVARASYFGTKLGHKILGADAGKTAFDDLQFTTHLLYNGNPWFMPTVLGWHRWADKLGL